MAVLDVMKTINGVKINNRYSFYNSDVDIILNNSENGFDFTLNLFKFGYAQGYKAAIADVKKKPAR